MLSDRQVQFVSAPSAAIKRTHRITPMNISVFSRGSNPAVDRHIQRKSLSFCTVEVEAGRAEWVDPADHSRGIIARDFLCFGEKLKPAQSEQVQSLRFRSSLPPLTVGGAQFDDPVKDFSKRADRLCLVVRARAFARFCDLEVLAQA